MSASGETRALPSIAVHWVKYNILAALISLAVALCMYGVRQAIVAFEADDGFGAVATLYAAAVLLWALSGCANGLLTGAVLQRIIPLLPARTWIGLHIVMTVIVGVWSEYMFGILPVGPPGADDVPIGATLLIAAVLGAGLGLIGGGLEALVLRKVARGTGAWIGWSTAAVAVAGAFFAGNASLWETEGGFAGELVHQMVGFVAALIITLVMLLALRRLRSPLLAGAGQHFA